MRQNHETQGRQGVPGKGFGGNVAIGFAADGDVVDFVQNTARIGQSIEILLIARSPIPYAAMTSNGSYSMRAVCCPVSALMKWVARAYHPGATLRVRVRASGVKR